jgi:hypothetical protein
VDITHKSQVPLITFIAALSQIEPSELNNLVPQGRLRSLLSKEETTIQQTIQLIGEDVNDQSTGQLCSLMSRISKSSPLKEMYDATYRLVLERVGSRKMGDTKEVDTNIENTVLPDKLNLSESVNALIDLTDLTKLSIFFVLQRLILVSYLDSRLYPCTRKDVGSFLSPKVYRSDKEVNIALIMANF